MCSNNLTLRLKEEVEALKGGVTTAAEHLQKSRNTIYNWFEKGNAPVDQVTKLGEIGIDLGYVFMGVKTPEHTIANSAVSSNKIHEGSPSYESTGRRGSRNKLDDRLASVIDSYVRDDILSMIVTTLDGVLNEKGLTMDEDTKARLIGAAQEGHEQLLVGNRTDKFSELLLALIEAALIEKNR